jgi:hypothetical protein
MQSVLITTDVEGSTQLSQFRQVSLYGKNVLSYFKNFYFCSLMLHGYKKPLTGSDVFGLNHRDTCNPAFLRFSRTRDQQENYRYYVLLRV